MRRAATPSATATVDLRDQHQGLRHVLADALLEANQHRFGVLQARADGQFSIDRDFSFIGRRLKLKTDSGEQQHSHREQHKPRREDGRPMGQRLVEHARVELIEAVERAVDRAIEPRHDAGAGVRLVRGVEHERAQHRDDGHGDQQRHRQRERHHRSQLAEHDARHAGQEQHRHEHGDVRQCGGQDGRPDFFAAVDGGGDAVLAHLEVAIGVLEHHDRGIDDHADAECQPAEGQGVQGVAAEVEQRERADHRDRNRRADDQRRLDVAQEQEDDRHDQQAAQHGVFGHAADGAVNELRLVVKHLQLDAVHLGVDLLNFLLHAFGNLNRVGARLLGHLHADARGAVDAHERAAVLGVVGYVGDVLQVDGHAGARQHHEVLDFVEAGELPRAAQQQGAVGVVDFAERDVLVLSAKNLDDAIGREVERGNLLARQVDVNLPAQAARDGHGRDAGDPLEARRQVVLGQFAQRHGVEVAFDADAHDRHRGRVELEHRRRVRIFRQAAAHAVKAGAHFIRCLAEVSAPGEVEPDVGVAFRRGRVDAVETGDGADRLLDRPRDQFLHFERPDARVVDAHRDGGHLRVWHQVNRQPGERDTAQQDDDHADHEHRDRTFDG